MKLSFLNFFITIGTSLMKHMSKIRLALLMAVQKRETRGKNAGFS